MDECKFCGKKYKKNYLLLHQKTAQFCLKIQKNPNIIQTVNNLETNNNKEDIKDNDTPLQKTLNTSETLYNNKIQLEKNMLPNNVVSNIKQNINTGNLSPNIDTKKCNKCRKVRICNKKLCELFQKLSKEYDILLSNFDEYSENMDNIVKTLEKNKHETNITDYVFCYRFEEKFIYIDYFKKQIFFEEKKENKYLDAFSEKVFSFIEILNKKNEYKIYTQHDPIVDEQVDKLFIEYIKSIPKEERWWQE